jgi:hypothetical protein
MTDPKLIALVILTLLLLAVCVVRSDRALSREHKKARSKQFDSHGHE